MSSPIEPGLLASNGNLPLAPGGAERAGSPRRYTATAVALHWIVAAAAVAMIGLGFWMISLPKGVGAFRADMYNLHKSIGITLGLIIFARIAWRIAHPAPPLPATLPRWQVLASRLNHTALYACLVIQPVTGVLGSSFSKYPIKYFGATLPFGGWDVPAAKEFLSVVHYVNVLVLIVLVLVHFGAALQHLLVARDGVFQRMWFRTRG
jgi:cytochrome b561